MDLTPLLPTLPQLNPSAQSILFHLAARVAADAVDMIAPGARIRASQNEIAGWTGLTRKTVQTGLKELIATGILKIIDPGQEDRSTEYEFCFPDKTKNIDQKPKPIPLLSSDDQVRLVAVKQGLSISMLNGIEKEAALLGVSKDEFIVRHFFGPDRLRKDP